MNWKLLYLPEAEKDYRSLDHNQQLIVTKAIDKICSNPLPAEEGGFGKPLGHKRGLNLTGYLKVKLRKEVVIGMRSDDEVYEIAQKRIQKHHL